MQHYVICFHLKFPVHIESLRNLFSSRLQVFHGKAIGKKWQKGIMGNKVVKC